MRDRGTLFLVFAVGASWLIAGITFWNSNVISGASNQEAYRQEVQNCLAQLDLPTSNNLAAINTANENLFAFIYNRSGVQVTQAAKNLIKDTGERAWSQARRTTVTQLSQILSDVAIERLSNSTEAEVNQAAETLQGFTASDLPTGFVQAETSVV